MKKYKKVFYRELALDLCLIITIVLDIIYLLLYTCIFINFKDYFSIVGWHSVAWFLTSIVYYLNKYFTKYKSMINKCSCKLPRLVYLVDKLRKIFSKNTRCYLLVIVNMIKYYSMISLLAKLNIVLKESHPMDYCVLKCILDVFAVFIVIILLLDLTYLIIPQLLMWVVLIIVLILIFGLFKMEDGVINWVFLALIFVSIKDMLSLDIKYLKSSDEITNLDSKDDIKLKRHIVDLKYSLLLIIPIIYLTLRILEKIMKTELYEKLFLLIMLERNNNSLVIIFESSVKLFISLLIINFVYKYRNKVFEKLKKIFFEIGG